MLQWPTKHCFSTRTDEPKYAVKEDFKLPILHYDVFKTIPPPEKSARWDIEAWIMLIEPALPIHLRQEHAQSHNAQEPPSALIPDANEVAEIILAARRSYDLDLLSHLGVHAGRWRAVVWLVKHLVEHVGLRRARGDRASQLLWQWPNAGCLADLTREPLSLERRGSLEQTPPPAAAKTLHELTDDLQPDRTSRDEILRHDIIGQIWRSLGYLTLTRTRGTVEKPVDMRSLGYVSLTRTRGTAEKPSDMTPEILEIIAYLHHSEIMPNSIYNYTPAADDTALRQPPTLHLLSSRILTSLSDAAWRAHESLIIEQAKARGGDHIAVRPEIPGSAYRVRISGLVPEVWMELILWSCLHGGWVADGAAILKFICQAKGSTKQPEWTLLSWRDAVRPMLPPGQEHATNWDELKHYWDTSKFALDRSRDDPAQQKVDQTISSEVVAAYIDALISITRVGVGERGIPPGQVFEYLEMLKAFLDRSALGLGGGSWDAMLLRFVESQGIDIEREPRLIDRLMLLSPSIGSEVSYANAQSAPSYVLDGTAATIGLLHRTLLAHIKNGNVQGALKTFKDLQMRTDDNKRRSVQDFFMRARSSAEEDDMSMEKDSFSSNFFGIEYPGFYAQLPATVLGPFLDLITDAKAIDFGSWLLYSDDLDGPVIPERMYGDPAIAPSLIRFATATDDRPLLIKILEGYSEALGFEGPKLPQAILQSYLDSQFNFMQWDSAERIIEYFTNRTDFDWSILNIATLGRVMLRLDDGSDILAGEGPIDLSRAAQIFAKMGRRKTERRRTPKVGEKDKQLTSLMTVIALIDSRWSRYCKDLKRFTSHRELDLSAKVFNTVLEGIVDTHGSLAGRRILGTIWPHTAREAIDFGERLKEGQGGVVRMPRFRPSSLDHADRTRNVITLPSLPDQPVALRGRFQPDATTIRIILRKALKELHEQHTEKLGSGDASGTEIEAPSSYQPEFATLEQMIEWAAKSMKRFGLGDTDIKKELGSDLFREDMAQVREELPFLFTRAEQELADDAVDSATNSDSDDI